jgi:hypothetical protein
MADAPAHESLVEDVHADHVDTSDADSLHSAQSAVEESAEVSDKLDSIDLNATEDEPASSSVPAPVPVSAADESEHNIAESPPWMATPKAARRGSATPGVSPTHERTATAVPGAAAFVDGEEEPKVILGKGRDSVSSMQVLDDGERDGRPSSTSRSRSLRMHSIDLSSSTSPTTPVNGDSGASSLRHSSLISGSAPLSDVSLDYAPVPRDLGIFSSTSSLSTTDVAPPDTPGRVVKTTSVATTSSAGHADFLLQRLEAQNALLKEDPKAKRASLGGREELRKGFEKLQSELEGREEVEGFIDWDFWGAVMSDYGHVASTRR